MGKKNTQVIFIVFVFLLCFFFFEKSFGANAEIISSWEAYNLYPANYEGKAFATPGSNIHISLIFIKNGKIINDFSKSVKSIKWYLDGTFMGDNENSPEIIFQVENSPGNPHLIKIIANVDNETISHFIEIPVIQRQVVIESKIKSNIVSPNTSLIFSAVPYFFTVNSIEKINFGWAIQNNKIESEKSNTLLVQFGEPKTESQKSIKISSLVNQKEGFLEQIVGDINLRIEK